jgi:septal ring factor EnvC (AmiA/AmiB activator)
MTQSTDQEIGEIKSAVAANNRSIDANSKAISDLTASIAGLREEMRVGFARLEGQIDNIETKLDGQIEVIKGELKVLDVKFSGKPKIGFWSLLFRGTAILTIASFVLAFLLS